MRQGPGQWGGAEREGRKETEHAWRVPVEQIKASNYNLDIKNPHDADTGPGDPDALLSQLQVLQTEIDDVRDRLKAELAAALDSRQSPAGTDAYSESLAPAETVPKPLAPAGRGVGERGQSS